MFRKLYTVGKFPGVVIPREEATNEGLKENDEVEIITRKAVDIRQLFGRYKFKDLHSLKDEMGEGWH